jgi:adenylate cyclase
VKIQEVGRELGVRYVLEGSVRRSATEVRITAQLADASSGLQSWSGRYDRELNDIFALQDEIARKIVTTLNLQLTLQKQGVLVRPSTDNMDAYDHFLQGINLCCFKPSREINLLAW